MTGGKSAENRFSIVLCSYREYEYLIAEISHDGVVVAIVNQEEGKQSMWLEASVGELVGPGIAWVVDLDDFLETVQAAKKLLLER